MKFYINHIQDSRIANNEKVLPILTMMLVFDGRHDFHKFHDMIQNADITFAMVDVESGLHKIANSPAFIKRIDGSDCTEEYEICYQFTKRELNTPGIYKGQFTIKFGDDLKNDSGENPYITKDGDSFFYPSGTLVMPIRNELEIIVK